VCVCVCVCFIVTIDLKCTVSELGHWEGQADGRSAALLNALLMGGA